MPQGRQITQARYSVGDRIFSPYPMEKGTIIELDQEESGSMWYYVMMDSGTRELLDDTRMEPI